MENTKLYFFSFVDTESESTDINERNLGCCAVLEENAEAALVKVSQLGINPGGEVSISEIVITEDATIESIEKYLCFKLDTLVSAKELINLGYKTIGDMTDEELEKSNTAFSTTFYCDEHNTEIKEKSNSELNWEDDESKS